ncbi:MAG: hypothetical protein J5I52_00245 [Saprospiraceae bacterium]|nr:hypothetical protein [Saprospiraceae bacterium]
MNLPPAKTLITFNIIATVIFATLLIISILSPVENQNHHYFYGEAANGIWLIVLFLMFLFCGYTAYQFKKQNQETTRIIEQIGAWYFIAAIGVSVWVYTWQHDDYVLSMCFILITLLSLAQFYKVVSTARPLKYDDNIYIHFLASMSFSWALLLSLANLAAFIKALGWSATPDAEAGWAALLIIVAALAGVVMIFKKQDVPFAVVVIIALFSVFTQSYEHNSQDTSTRIITASKFSLTLLTIYTVLNIIGKRVYLFDKIEVEKPTKSKKKR